MQDQLKKISALVEELASKVVLLSADSTGELEDILSGFNKVSALAVEGDIALIETLARTAAGITAGVMVGSVTEGISIETIGAAVSCIQEVLRVIDDEEAIASVKIPKALRDMSGGALDSMSTHDENTTNETVEQELADDEVEVQAAETVPEPAQVEEKIPSEEEDIQAVKEGDADLLQDFIAESNDHLDQAEKSILGLEEDPENAEEINAIFRAFHTIKGVAGFLGVQRVQMLAHHAETLLDKVRKDEIALTDTRIDIIFESLDGLKILINDIQEILAGNDPEGVPEYGSLIGKLIGSASVNDDTLPVVTSEDKLGEILVESGAASEEQVQSALLEQSELADDVSGKPPLGEILIKQGAAKPKDVGKALRAQSKARKAETVTQDEGTVRVGTGRLDNLINMVGELVIAQAMVSQDSEIKTLSNQRIERNMSHLGKITRDLQELSMAMRMVPINSTFQKMARLVRDLAKKSGKKIKFGMTGEETELDRNLIEVLHDPLVHMVRNSADHGIEKPEERIAAGKPEEGQVDLRAYHLGGHIVVEIKDDGKGLDKEALLAKAREKGIIGPHQELSEEETYNLIFHAGLSTAKQITDISGRGVGMDVVRSNIEKLRGKVEIKSEKGKGSTFSISLPLTLAIIDGMIIRVGDEKMIIPLNSIVESFQPAPQQLNTVQGRGEMINMRDRLLHLARFNRLYNIIPDTNDPTEAIIIVVSEGNRECGLMVDEILGQQQVVIKSLGDTMQGIPGIAGGTILGDGKVALIVDVASLIELSSNPSMMAVH